MGKTQLGNYIGYFSSNPTNIDNFSELFIIWHNLWVERTYVLVYNTNENFIYRRKGKTDEKI